MFELVRLLGALSIMYSTYTDTKLLWMPARDVETTPLLFIRGCEDANLSILKIESDSLTNARISSGGC